MTLKNSPARYPKAREAAEAALVCPVSPQSQSSTYRLAFTDKDFLLRDELRPVRLQLELMKPELILQEQGIKSTIVIFGGTRVPERAEALEQLRQAEAAAEREPLNPLLKRRAAVAQRVAAKSCFYEEAQKLGRLVAESCRLDNGCDYVVTTGGGPGIMEAASRGALEAGGKAIGLNIVLPHEQAPNRYISPELCFQFHYFAIRKMHFLMRARALIAFPGGYGTMDELFETLTLIQTKKIKPLPVLLFGREFWSRAIDFDFLVDEGVIAQTDPDIFHYVETAAEAWQCINDFYRYNGEQEP
ncbi:MAG: TIGR00730 family Rossman fold protein [Deltaproteobacteria bacterium CG_4_10_14_3_um_filter_60_8]|nr:MAG: Rossman fold protein, TIGR00730 family [Desulfobacterales bacterium CG2_30_60_27]PIY25250.1 MAG: TIGR00730 family Rossman fold protein [Deltaproteobacteria bacterium CG_4_10_14_3_um_filter_60_8]